MASLSSSYVQKLILILVITILLAGPSSATSRGYTTMQPVQEWKNDMGSINPGSLSTMLPKGKPVPPSGPSKRHNSVVDSTPQKKIMLLD
ncbi:hypothetical protein E3N88_19679 [Mikania micrantha]|uniref:Transmembrane protein n=1 Tax=Mikania micrantha TaxID=192012 RepID=A0A5N6NQW0_9ASTR|nr:hypothetical protein E3N88_19679 [Mikania micrantha]